MDFIDRHAIVATSILLTILYFTLYVIEQMVTYGTEGIPSLEKAAIIAAILTPISGLQAAVISFYSKRKDSEKKEKE